jgi:GNAT superfamily N-acetyltransferase
MPQALFDNHLAFMRSHRGELAIRQGMISITGETPGLPFWAPCNDDAEVPQACDSMRLLPWSGASWPERLAQQGFAPAEAFTYMELAGDIPAPAFCDPGIEITVAASESDALVFAATQGAGFLDESHADTPRWHACFRERALQHFANPDQTFYLASLCGEPAAVALVVRTPGLTGIYAVTTRAEYRNRGLSGALLRRAVEDAQVDGTRRIILQAMQGSYAEAFYGRLGFTPRFVSRQWRRA